MLRAAGVEKIISRTPEKYEEPLIHLKIKFKKTHLLHMYIVYTENIQTLTPYKVLLKVVPRR